MPSNPCSPRWTERRIDMTRRRHVRHRHRHRHRREPVRRRTHRDASRPAGAPRVRGRRSHFPGDVLSGHIIQPSGVDRLAHWGLLARIATTGDPFADRVRFDFGDVVLEGSPVPVDGMKGHRHSWSRPGWASRSRRAPPSPSRPTVPAASSHAPSAPRCWSTGQQPRPPPTRTGGVSRSRASSSTTGPAGSGGADERRADLRRPTGARWRRRPVHGTDRRCVRRRSRRRTDARRAARAGRASGALPLRMDLRRLRPALPRTGSGAGR